MPTAVLLADDAWLARRLARLDADFGLRWVAADAAEDPALIVVDLAAPGAADQVGSARRRWPGAIVAGYLSVPDHDRWVAGQRAGCDLVANRGALAARLRPLLAAAGRGRRTFPVLAEADLAGRLGLVARVAETPVGPVAVYQVTILADADRRNTDGTIHVAADRCPHAGAVLSEGEVDRRVVTCPRHGSQFDVCTGERLRGPADAAIRTFPVVIADGQVSIIIDT